MNQEFEHNANDHEDPLPGWSWSVGIIGTILVVVIVLGVTALKNSWERTVWDEMRVAPDLPGLRTVSDRDHQRLHGDYRIVERRDVEDNVDRHLVIPIDRAIDLTAAEHGTREPSS